MIPFFRHLSFELSTAPIVNFSSPARASAPPPIPQALLTSFFTSFKIYLPKPPQRTYHFLLFPSKPQRYLGITFTSLALTAYFIWTSLTDGPKKHILSLAPQASLP